MFAVFYHSSTPHICVDSSCFTMAALVDTNNKEDAYRLMNYSGGHTSLQVDSPPVLVSTWTSPLRSMGVNDLLVGEDGKNYLCSNFGWDYLSGKIAEELSYRGRTAIYSHLRNKKPSTEWYDCILPSGWQWVQCGNNWRLYNPRGYYFLEHPTREGCIMSLIRMMDVQE